MGIQEVSMINMLRGGGCCFYKPRRLIQINNTITTKNEIQEKKVIIENVIIEKIIINDVVIDKKKMFEQNNQKLKIMFEQLIKEQFANNQQEIKIIIRDLQQSCQNQIRIINQYEQIITIEEYNQCQENLLNYLKSLQSVMTLSQIQAHLSIQLCLKILIEIYKCQVKDKNAILEKKYSEQYQKLIQEIKSSTNKCQILQYDVQILDIAIQNCRKEIQEEIQIKEDLLIHQRQVDILNLCREYQYLLNFNYESYQNSIKHFQLYCLYQMITKKVIYQIQDENQETVTNITQMLQMIYIYQFKDKNNLLFHRHWIQLIFELLILSKQEQESGPNTNAQQLKIQDFSNNIMQVYLRFYAQLKIKDDPILPQQIQAYLDPNIKYIKTLSAALTISAQNTQKIFVAIGSQEIKRRKNFLTQQINLISQLKNEYFKFIRLSYNIYQVIKMAIQKSDLIRSLQIITKEQIETIGLTIDDLKFFDNFKECNKKLISSIIKFEQQVTNNTIEQQTNDQRLAIENDLIEINQFISNIQELFFKLEQNNEQQYFLFQHQLFLQKLMQNTRYSLQQENQEDNYEQQGVQTNITLKYALEITLSMLNDNTYQQFYFQIIENNKTILPQQEQARQIEDLNDIQLRFFWLEISIQSLKVYQIQRGKQIEQIIQTMNKIYNTDTRSLQDLLNQQNQRITDIFSRLNYIGITKLKQQFKRLYQEIHDDKFYVLNSYASNILKQNFEDLNTQILKEIDQIISFQVINQQENNEYVENDYLREKRIKLKNLFSNAIQQDRFETTIPEIFKKMNQDKWLTLEQLFKKEQLDIKQQIKTLRYITQILRYIIQSLANNISILTNSNDQNKKNKILRQTLYQIQKQIEDSDLQNLIMKIHRDENINPNIIQYFNQKISRHEFNQFDQIYQNKVFLVQNIEYDNLNCSKRINFQGPISTINICIIDYILLYGSSIIQNNKIALKYISNKFFQLWVYEIDSTRNPQIVDEIKRDKISQRLLINNLQEMLNQLLNKLKDQQNSLNLIDELEQKINILRQLFIITQNTIYMLNYLQMDDIEFVEFQKDTINEIRKLQGKKQRKPIPQEKNQQKEDFKQQLLQYKQSRKISIQKRELELNSIQIKQRFKVKKYDEDNKTIQRIYEYQDILYQNLQCQKFGEINQFLSNQQLQVLLLLGLEGSGKTSELINLENKLWQQYNLDNESKQNWIPIYISFSQIIGQFKEFLLYQMQQIFNYQIFVEQFINSVNEERQRVLFLIDNIDDIKIEVFKNNFVELFFKILGFKLQCFGSSVKFIVSARSQFQTYQNYQLFFSGTRIDSILEIELLPFDDEQRKQYFIQNNKRNAKQILFKYYSSLYEKKQLNTQQFEDFWKQFENQFDNENKLEIKDIKQIQLFKDLSYQQQVNLEKDLLNLKNSSYYLNLIKEQNIQFLTQTAFQLELFTYVYPLLIKQFDQFFIKQQIRNQYQKLKKKSASNRNKITNENSFLDSVSGIASSNGTQYFQDNNNKVDEIINKLNEKGFFKNYQCLINLEGNKNRIIMVDQIYNDINNSQIIVEALKAKKLTSYQIIELYVNSLNKKYFKNLEEMYKIQDFEIALEQIDQFYQQLAINMTLNNQYQINRSQEAYDEINVSFFNEEETLFINTDLISIQDDHYSFKNKIIQDFYVAKYIYQNLTNETFLHQIENSYINRESFNLTFNNFTGVVNILRDQLFLYEGIQQSLVNLIKRSENSCFIRASSNCIFLISILNLNIERESLQSISISDTNISGISFLYSNLSNSKFNNVIMNNCNFDQAILNDVIWDNIQIREVGHLSQSEYIEEVMFSPDGSLLVSLSLILIKIWDFKTQILRYQNQIFNNCFNQMAISHNSQLLATYTNDQLILIELHRFEKIKTVRLDSKPNSLINFSFDNEVVGIIDSKGYLKYCQCTDQSIQFREKKIGHNKINPQSSNKFLFAQDKRYFIFKGEQRAIELFDILSEDISPLQELDADQFIVSSNGSLAISFNNNLIIYSWIDNNFKKKIQINFFQQIVNLSSYHVNQTIFLHFKDSVIIWNSQDQFLKGIYKDQGLEKFCFHPKGNILACWKRGKRNVKLCDLDSINSIVNCGIFDSNIVKAEYSLNGCLIIVQLSQKIIFWDFINMECQRILNDKTDFCISQKGNFLAATSPKGIDIWDCSNIYHLQHYFSIEDIYKIQKIFFCNKSQKLAIITQNQEILKFWDIDSIIKNQKNPTTLNVESEKIICIAISPTNSTIAYVCNTNNSIIQIYDLKCEIVKRQLKGHGKQIFSIDYSKNGKFLASRSLDRSIKVWCLEQAGSISISLTIKHNSQLLNYQHCCVWIPNDQLILASNQENKIILWEFQYTHSEELKRNEKMFKLDEANNQKQILTYSMSEIVDLQCSGYECLYITFSPNGNYIASLHMNLNNISIISNQHSQQFINPQIIVWDFNTKNKLMAIQISQWQKISFLSDSSSIVYHHYDQNKKTNLIKIHPISKDPKQKPIEFVIGCQSPFQYLIFSPQKNYFLAFKQESYYIDHVFLYNFDYQQQPKIIDYFQLKSESAFSFTPDGKQLVYSSQKKIQFLQILDSSIKIRLLNLNSYGLKLNSLKLNENSDLIGFSIIQKKLIILSEFETFQLSNQHFEFEIKSVYFQNKMILCGKQNDYGIIKIFDISNKDNIILKNQIQNQQKVCNILYFDNNRNILAIQDDEFLIKIYQLIDEQQYQCNYQIEQKLEMSTICFSSNQKDILAVSIKGKMFLYNIKKQINQEQNTCPKLQLLKTLPNNFLIQANNCEIKNAQINSRFNSLLELFKYQGAKDQ